jgi:hypothetical protein
MTATPDLDKVDTSNGRFVGDKDDVAPLGKMVHTEDKTSEMNAAIRRAHRKAIEEEATDE